MNYITITTVLYRAIAALFAVALLVLVLVHGYAPMGLSATWEHEGSRLVVLRTASVPAVGDQAAFWSETGGVRVVTVAEAARVEGMQFYRPHSGVWEPSYGATHVSGTVALAVPFVGWLAQALSTVWGVLLLIGSPLVMFVVDILQRALERRSGEVVEHVDDAYRLDDEVSRDASRTHRSETSKHVAYQQSFAS